MKIEYIHFVFCLYFVYIKYIFYYQLYSGPLLTYFPYEPLGLGDMPTNSEKGCHELI